MYLEKGVTLRLDKLKKKDKNIRRHSASQIAEYKRSIEQNGQLRPIVCDENYVIRCGNGLWQAMTELGMKEADVYIAHEATEKELLKLEMADNRIFNLGSDDMQVFEEFVAELDGDFDVPGYDMELLKMMSFDDDDIDEVQSSYGIISQKDKENLQKQEEKLEKKYEEEAQKAEQIEPKTLEEVEVKPELERRYILCPKCGEKIWL